MTGNDGFDVDNFVTRAKCFLLEIQPNAACRQDVERSRVQTIQGECSEVLS